MTTQTIYVSKDSYTAQNHPNTNYGSSNALLVDNRTSINKRMFIEFDISTAPSTITSVYLYLYRHTDGVCIQCVGKYRRITSSWVENTITWNTGVPTTTDTNETQVTYPNTHEEWQSVNITNLYNDAKSAGNILGLRFHAHYSDDYAEFYSRETSYDPYILITYTPVYDDYYVKVGGNDSLDGGSWANAWATINKAATTVADGKTVHIGFGDYVLEPAANKIAPQNIGATGIFYLPETAGTGGGTGTVSIEQNA